MQPVVGALDAVQRDKIISGKPQVTGSLLRWNGNSLVSVNRTSAAVLGFVATVGRAAWRVAALATETASTASTTRQNGILDVDMPLSLCSQSIARKQSRDQPGGRQSPSSFLRFHGFPPWSQVFPAPRFADGVKSGYHRIDGTRRPQRPH